MSTDGSRQTRQTTFGDATGGRISNGTLVFRSSGQLFRKDLSPASQPVSIPNTAGVLEFDLDPSGTKLILTYTANFNFDLYTMNIDGSGKRQINGVGFHHVSPSYGRDGYIYLVQSTFGDAYTQKVYRIAEDGFNNAALLTNYFTQTPSPGGPGNRIAFLYNQPSPMLRVMNADGSGQTDVPNSPSGIYSHVAFDYERDAIYYQLGSQIWSINTDGSNRRLLADGADFNEGVDYGTAFNSAPVCSYSISERSLTFSSNGGASSLLIATAPACAWSVRSDVPWIATPLASGLGTVPVVVIVAANSASSPRTGTLIVGGQTLTLTQAGSAPLFVVSPDVLNFTYRQFGAAPDPQALSVLSDARGLTFSTSFASRTGPSGFLSVSPAAGSAPGTLQISLNTTGLTPGFYSGELTVSAPGAQPPSRTVTVNLTVERQDARPPSLSVDASTLFFPLAEGGIAGSARLAIGNTGRGTLRFQVSAFTTSGGQWLSIAPREGAAAFNASGSVVVQADPSGLPPGSYSGAVTITTSEDSALVKTVTVPVTMIVQSTQQSLVLSQTGLSFTAVIAGGPVQPQSFGVLNMGHGAMNWTVQTSTPGQRVNWLSIAPSSGVTDAASLTIPFVTVGVDPSGLAAGTYSGQIQVNAPGALGSDQYISVVLEVLPPGSDPGPSLRPTGLIFVGHAGGAPPAAQTLTLSTIGSARSYNSSFLPIEAGLSWATVNPLNGVVSPAAPTRITISPNTAGLSPGIRRGLITYGFDGSAPRIVETLLVLTGPTSGPGAARQAAGCTPKNLTLVSTQLNRPFSVPVGWPVALEALVVDDCGDPFTAGSVTATFSNGDPPLAMVSLKNGRWTGTWSPKDSRVSEMTITLLAEAPVAGPAPLRGMTVISGLLNTNVTYPVINAGGVVSSASPKEQLSLAPGSLVSIFGSRLADGAESAAAPPWNTTLGGAKAILGGFELPLAYTSDGQIKAIVPYDVPTPGFYPLTVARGAAYATPETVSVAAAQPAIFSVNETGFGQGLIYVVSDSRPASAGGPAHPGDVVAIFCTGLGAVSPAVQAGSVAPDAPQSTLVNPVMVTIGGIRAEVVSAGLAPGTVGRYRVDAIVPDGISGVVEVALTVAGQPSPPVTMVVQ
jgi:uncharacterized protein (TIGR03437 family)